MSRKGERQPATVDTQRGTTGAKRGASTTPRRILAQITRTQNQLALATNALADLARAADAAGDFAGARVYARLTVWLGWSASDARVVAQELRDAIDEMPPARRAHTRRNTNGEVA